MSARNIQETLTIDGLDVRVLSEQGGADYISLTDLARKKTDHPRTAISNWMRLKDTIDLLGIWESMNNKDFNGDAFESFLSEAGRNAFTMTPTKWVEATQAIGIKSQRGRYGAGTFAHVDIALDFAAWISPEFRLYVFQEYRRLKMDESSRLNSTWQQNRLFSAMNYRIHTDAVKEKLLPENVDRKLAGITYAREAELLNLAVFGITSKEWRANNPGADGNMRDRASASQLLILNNLEAMNATLIHNGMDYRQRYDFLFKAARQQEKTFEHHPTVRKLEDEQRRQLEGGEHGHPAA